MNLASEFFIINTQQIIISNIFLSLSFQILGGASSNVRAVPVPSQRLAYAKMEEKRNSISSHHLNNAMNIQRTNNIRSPNSAAGGNTDANTAVESKVPSIEYISLPTSKILCLFYSCPLSRLDSIISSTT